MSGPAVGSHWWPRTRAGRIALIWFGLSFVATQPPVTHYLVNRVEPIVLGYPFLYVWLFAAYVSMIAALVWTYRRRL